MSELAIHRPQLIPLPSVNIAIRPGEMRDVPFLDSLQKLHTRQVGWMPTKQFEGKIKAGHVLVAESSGGRVSSPAAAAGDSRPPECIGYLIGNDQYFKRDDVGIIYQMNVLPGRQRGLIGASLLKAQFERSAYGCRLYCCWCAQDIAANHFWEAMGFVPLAYRAGSEKKGPGGSPRVHIFWQKRIRQGDTTTPWWFPSQTSGGSIREDRIVLPIPPGTHWNDAKPVVLPALSSVEGPNVDCQLTIEEKKPRVSNRKSAIANRKPPAPPKRPMLSGGLQFAPAQPAEVAKEKAKRQPKVKQKNDPRLIAAARELRDRWLEQVAADPTLIAAGGKYEVARSLAGPLPNPPPSTGEGVKALLSAPRHRSGQAA